MGGWAGQAQPTEAGGEHGFPEEASEDPRGPAVTGVAAALTVGLSAPSGAATSGAATSGGAAASGRGGDGQQVRLDRAFIIVLENHSQKSVIGDPNTPYITSLAQQYGQAAEYFGVTHPSEPNYIAMIGGSNWFTNNDNPANRFDHTNLVDELDASHISWGAYMEAMPASDPLTDFWPSSANPLYASKHNPFALFTDIRDNPARVANIKPYTALAGDLNSPHAPRFVFITPDQCNDMHGGVNTAVTGHPETPCPFSNANDDAADVLLKHNADAFVKTAVSDHHVQPGVDAAQRHLHRLRRGRLHRQRGQRRLGLPGGLL